MLLPIKQVIVTEFGVEHALRVKIARGDVVVKIGTALGFGEYWDVELAEGEYSLAFVPHRGFLYQAWGAAQLGFCTSIASRSSLPAG